MRLYSRRIIILFLYCCIISSQVSGFSGTLAAKLNAYDVKFYFLDLQVDNLSENIEGSVTVQIEITDPDIDTIVLELTDSALVDSVLINSNAALYSHSNNFLFIPVSGPISPATIISIAVFYRIPTKGPDSVKGTNTKVTESGKSVTWTLSEPFYAKNWFPCKQILDDKADSVYLFFTVADSLHVGSNGVLTSVTDLPDGKKRYEWKSYYPTAYYLISFAVADYLDYSFYIRMNATDSILVQNYIYNDSTYFRSNKESIDATGQMLIVFHDRFGPYPFAREKYGHCIAPIGGGMEHQTMTTLDNFGFVLVAHELAHQWFGNNVTCQNWQDIWINEGFASYCELVAIENLKTYQEVQEWLSEAYELIVSEPGGSIFLPLSDSTNPSRIFDYRLTYRKGAYILHMLRHELGSDEIFFEVLRTFQKQYKNNVATSSDFISLLETISQRDFSEFFYQWYFGEGYPILDLHWTQRSDTLSLTMVEEVSSPTVTPFFNLLIDLKINYIGGDTLVQLRQTSPESTFQIVLNKRIYQIIPDPENKLLADIRSVVREFDGDSVPNFSAFPNPASTSIFVENYQIGLPFTAKLYSTNGIMLEETSSSEAFGSFDISALDPGIYQIVVFRDQHKEVFKIAKL